MRHGVGFKRAGNQPFHVITTGSLMLTAGHVYLDDQNVALTETHNGPVLGPGVSDPKLGTAPR